MDDETAQTVSIWRKGILGRGGGKRRGPRVCEPAGLPGLP